MSEVPPLEVSIVHLERAMSYDPKKAYAEEAQKVEGLLRDIDFLARKHQDRAGRDPSNWGYVGDLTQVVSKLQEVKDFLKLPR